MNDCSPEINPRTEVAVRNLLECRPVFNSGKADASREETSTCTVGTAGVGVQASGERIRRDSVGKVPFPAGADCNLHRPAVQGTNRGGGRGRDWHMSA